MGICSSCDSTHVTTAKLILQDGRLVEFPSPVKVSSVLQKNPTCFICNSDDMDFDDEVSAISGDEELQLGQLYFALPLSWLRHPLQAEEMAALAVKASSALMKTGRCGGDKCRCRRKCVAPVVFPADESRRRVTVGEGSAGGESRRGGGHNGRRKTFTARLTSIEE